MAEGNDNRIIVWIASGLGAVVALGSSIFVSTTLNSLAELHKMDEARGTLIAKIAAQMEWNTIRLSTLESRTAGVESSQIEIRVRQAEIKSVLERMNGMLVDHHQSMQGALKPGQRQDHEQ